MFFFCSCAMLRAGERAQFPLTSVEPDASACGAAAPAAPDPHYTGHGMRLRERFLDAAAAALADYELLDHRLIQ
jgi:hypothetical protein